MPAVAAIKLNKRSIVAGHALPDDGTAAFQVLTTLLPVLGLWYLLTLDTNVVYAVAAAVTVVMSLFLLRAFVLMHDCGHGSLFSSVRLNKSFGFGLGVLAGMPQYVWAQHHNYHHATNGNWAKYRGPMNILTVNAYDRLPRWRQRLYVGIRNISLAPLAGFFYLIVNPRVNWLRGTAGLAWHILRGKAARPDRSLRALAQEYKTPYWASAAEFRHMSSNNLVLLAAWALMCWAIGPALFFSVYVASVSIAGGAGIVLFTVQHNFEHSYATGNLGWDYDAAALHGTSFLVLPAWLNWFTADIGYHHIHHISAKIPNYCLADCHAEHQHLFAGVKRLTLADVRPSLRFMLWDPRRKVLVSVAEHESAKLAACRAGAAVEPAKAGQAV